MNEISPSTDDPTAHEDSDWPPVMCPLWCTGGHRSNDHPEDRQHRSRATLVPVTLRESLLTTELEHVELIVQTVRERDSRVTWCSITAHESDQPRLHLTAESAELLRAALAALPVGS